MAVELFSRIILTRLKIHTRHLTLSFRKRIGLAKRRGEIYFKRESDRSSGRGTEIKMRNSKGGVNYFGLRVAYTGGFFYLGDTDDGWIRFAAGRDIALTKIRGPIYPRRSWNFDLNEPEEKRIRLVELCNFFSTALFRIVGNNRGITRALNKKSTLYIGDPDCDNTRRTPATLIEEQAMPVFTYISLEYQKGTYLLSALALSLV